MKLYSFLIIFYSIFIFVSNESNININEEYIKSILIDFYPEIRKIFDNMKYDELFKSETILFKIPEFTIDKVSIEIKDNGIVNIKLKDVVPILRKEIPRIATLRVVRNFIVQLNDFELEINYKINNKNDLDKFYVPEVERVGEPIINYNPEIISNYREMKEQFKSMIENGEFNLIYIEPIIKHILNTILETIIESYQTKQ